MEAKQKFVLLLGKKAKILKRLKNGEAGTKLAVEYSVRKPTISNIKGMQLTKLCTCGSYKNTYLINQLLDPLLSEKALFLKEKWNGENSFQANSRLLQNFKLHYGK